MNATKTLWFHGIATNKRRIQTEPLSDSWLTVCSNKWGRGIDAVVGMKVNSSTFFQDVGFTLKLGGPHLVVNEGAPYARFLLLVELCLESEKKKKSS